MISQAGNERESGINIRGDSNASSAQGIPDEGGLAYLDMKDGYYYGATLTYFGLIVAGSILIPSVDEIFEFVGAICVNALSFILPAIFYLVSDSRYKFNREAKVEGFNKNGKPPPANKILIVSAYFQLTLGIGAFVLGMFNNIHGIIYPEAGEH